MNAETQEFRNSIIDWVKILSNSSAQLAYERDVPIANVPAELICGFVDDLYHPESKLFLNAFTEIERVLLAGLNDGLCVASDAITEHGCQSVTDIHKLHEWDLVMSHAEKVLVELGKP